MTTPMECLHMWRADLVRADSCLVAIQRETREASQQIRDKVDGTLSALQERIGKLRDRIDLVPSAVVDPIRAEVEAETIGAACRQLLADLAPLEALIGSHMTQRQTEIIRTECAFDPSSASSASGFNIAPLFRDNEDALLWWIRSAQTTLSGKRGGADALSCCRLPWSVVRENLSRVFEDEVNEGDERVQRNSEESEDVSRILTKTELSKLKQSLVSQKEDGKTSEWVSAAKFATWCGSLCPYWALRRLQKAVDETPRFGSSFSKSSTPLLPGNTELHSKSKATAVSMTFIKQGCHRSKTCTSVQDKGIGSNNELTAKGGIRRKTGKSLKAKKGTVSRTATIRKSSSAGGGNGHRRKKQDTVERIREKLLGELAAEAQDLDTSAIMEGKRRP